MVICRCLKHVAASFPALYGGIMETVCLIWGDFLFSSYKPTSGGLCLNTVMSFLGTDRKKTGSKALGCVGNGTYEVLVVPKKCTKLLKHV